MSQEKKVRVGVDTGGLNDLQRKANSVLEGMIRNSKAYTTSSKEILKDLEEQIKQLEKRARLEKQSEQSRLREHVTSGKISKDEFWSGANAAKQKEDAVLKLIPLMREQIDVIKQTSKQEIREDRSNVENQIRHDKTLNQIGGVIRDPQGSLKRGIQRDILGQLGFEEADEKQKYSKFRRGAGSTFNTAASIGTSKNELYALAALVGLTPVIGQGLSAIAQRMLTAGETAEKSKTAYGAVRMGSNYSSLKGEWGGIYADERFAQMGLDPSTVLNRKAAISKLTGRAINNDSLASLFGAEAYIGSGNVDSLASVNRYGGGSMNKVVSILEGNQRNTTLLNENVSTYIQVANRHLELSSKINEGSMARNVMGLSSGTGLHGIGLQQAAGAIQGLGGTTNPVVRSLMMRAFRQSNPNASLFDIQAMMEDPLANLDKGGSQFFNNIKRMSGGGDMYKRVLYKVFGGQLSLTRINEILNNGGDFTNLSQEAKAAKAGSFDMVEGRSNITGIGAAANARAEGFFQDWGQETLELGKDTVEQLKELKLAYETATTAVGEKIDSAADKLVLAIEEGGLKGAAAKTLLLVLSTNNIIGEKARKEFMNAVKRLTEQGII